MALRKLKNFYDKYERHISSLSLIGGFVFDAVTLKRVDLFLENFWVFVHLLVASLGILLLNVFENRKQKMSELRQARIHFWLIIITQFAFGGLLSTFLVFYFRSATLAAGWPFLLLLAIVFACNELLKKHYTKVVFQTIVLYICIYAFAIYIVPVFLHRIGDDVFIVSSLISLAALLVFLILLWVIARERFTKSFKILSVSILGIVILVNILYFTNLIPPLPLSLKDAGVYHTITKNSDGNYVGEYETNSLNNYFNFYPLVHLRPGKTLYVFTAIFSPAELNTTVIHAWQYYDDVKGKWIDSNKITLPIIGGRDGGYRTYSFKSSLTPGKWRVNVLTLQGLLIGRVKFLVSTSTESFSVATSTL